MNDVLLETRGVRKLFGEFVALKGVDLDVRAGEIHALIGPNGAGKSTYFGVVSGELRPNAGTVRFAGRAIGALPAWERTRLGIARAFQIARVFATFTVEENVRAAVLAGEQQSWIFYRSTRAAGGGPATATLLAETGLASLAASRAADLSHGDRKRLEIAMALALRPRLLMLDEPTAGMSPPETEATIELIRAVWHQRGCGVLLTEHDMQVVFQLAHRITVLHHGEVLRSGDPDAIAHDPAVLDVYLGRGLTA